MLYSFNRERKSLTENNHLCKCVSHGIYKEKKLTQKLNNEYKIKFFHQTYRTGPLIPEPSFLFQNT